MLGQIREPDGDEFGETKTLVQGELAEHVKHSGGKNCVKNGVFSGSPEIPPDSTSTQADMSKEGVSDHFSGPWFFFGVSFLDLDPTRTWKIHGAMFSDFLAVRMGNTNDLFSNDLGVFFQ